MKKSEATPGTKVIASYHTNEWGGDTEIVSYRHDEYGDTTLVGVIRSKPASPGKVWVKWIEGDLVDEEAPEDQEVELKILALESELATFEKEFKEIEKQVKQKMKQAADLVKEAGKLAKKGHVDSLESMYDAVAPLINAMDSNGWRSSSWGC